MVILGREDAAALGVREKVKELQQKSCFCERGRVEGEEGGRDFWTEGEGSVRGVENFGGEGRERKEEKEI